MARESGSKALADAGIDYREVQEAYVGYVYGESTSGQRAVYELGMTGIPVVNVNNNCSTGSTALYLAARAVRSGLADCALALGFEKMQPGSLDRHTTIVSSRWPSTSWRWPRSQRCAFPPAAVDVRRRPAGST